MGSREAKGEMEARIMETGSNAETGEAANFPVLDDDAQSGTETEGRSKPEELEASEGETVILDQTSTGQAEETSLGVGHTYNLRSRRQLSNENVEERTGNRPRWRY